MHTMRLLLPILSLSDPAKEPQTIVGAFGLKLGDVFDPEKATGRTKSPEGKVIHYGIKPMIPFRSMHDYYVRITPKTKRIYAIWAKGVLGSSGAAKKEKTIILDFLKEKYGGAKGRQ